MSDEVIKKGPDGVRERVPRDRASSVYIVHVDLNSALEEGFEELKKQDGGVADKTVGLKILGDLGYVPTSKGLFLLNTEGSAPESEDPVTDDNPGPIPVYKKSATGMTMLASAIMTLTRKEILELPVIRVVNLGKWVRKFGHRLEDNFHNWDDLLTDIYDAEHVAKIEAKLKDA